jgi:hypothetical protein
MMSCESFRTRFHVSTEDAELLEHVRTCDRCLDFAAQADPDVMFRALGGDLVPPGGVDAFVGDVMSQVRVRAAETAMTSHPEVSWTRRLAIAATIAVAVTGGTLVYRNEMPATAPAGVTHADRAPRAELATKPIVETYDSENATIVEVPTDPSDDVKIVMIFDENLPADL